MQFQVALHVKLVWLLVEDSYCVIVDASSYLETSPARSCVSNIIPQQQTEQSSSIRTEGHSAVQTDEFSDKKVADRLVQ